jgi:hypothetical protein
MDGQGEAVTARRLRTDAVHHSLSARVDQEVS